MISCIVACMAAGCMLKTGGMAWWTEDGQADPVDEDTAVEIDIDAPDPIVDPVLDPDALIDPDLVADPDAAIPVT